MTSATCVRWWKECYTVYAQDYPGEICLITSAIGILVYKKFNAWSAKGIWAKVFEFLVVEPDLGWGFIDGSYVKAHPHSSGAVTLVDQAIGRSRAGNTSTIPVLQD